MHSVDIGCLITFIPSLISGLVLYFVLPSGGGGFGDEAVLAVAVHEGDEASYKSVRDR